VYSFWQHIQKACALILTVSGIVLIPLHIHAIINTEVITNIVIAFILVALGISALTYFYRTPINRAFGVRRYITPGFIISKVQDIRIDKNYSAIIDVKSSLLFLEQPRQEDLLDRIDALPHIEINPNFYISSDSTIADVVRANPSHLAVYWKPIEKIEALTPYAHEMSYKSPDHWGDDGFYHANYIDREIGHFEAHYFTEVPIVDAFAFIMPRFVGKITPRRLYRYGFRRPRRGCPQPTVDAAGFRMNWHIDRPINGRAYVLFAVYQDQHSAVQSWFESRLPMLNIRTKIKRRFSWRLSIFVAPKSRGAQTPAETA
jgi:hypothetical protein